MFSSLSSDTARRERERGSTPRVLCHVGREFRFNYSDSDCCDLRGVGFVCDACHRCAVTSFAAGRDGTPPALVEKFIIISHISAVGF